MSKNEISVIKIRKSCHEVSAILKALSHPMRLLILSHLINGPKTVSDIVSMCEISQSQVSQFLIRMKHEGLIFSRREKQFQVYELADERLRRLVKTIQNEYCEKRC